LESGPAHCAVCAFHSAANISAHQPGTSNVVASRRPRKVPAGGFKAGITLIPPPFRLSGLLQVTPPVRASGHIARPAPRSRCRVCRTA
jgi:hypothetical protein